jgi:hypothetical protein
VRATTSILLSVLLIPALALTLPAEPGEYPDDYFRSPLGIPILLSGNFAEMRDGHFHGGLDIKTRESEGYRVYAAADGYVERVRVSPYGYGNALYVAHPNGYSTVYAHLSRLKGDIVSYVRSRQYARKSFEVDEYPEPGRFPVKKGQVIALSGNSGSSSGPHLHFEIRTSRDQVPVNPLLFGFDVEDSRRPRIFRVRLYPIGEGSGVLSSNDAGRSGPAEPLTVEVDETGGTYRLETTGTLTAWGQLAFGIQTHDYHNGSRSRLGAYQITLTVDGEEYYVSTMERISFGDTRYINAHVDYAERRANRRWIQRSHRLPGNRLPIYKHVNDGVVMVTAGDTLSVRYRVEDASGNSTELEFPVVGIPAPGNSRLREPAPTVMTVRYDEPFVLRREDIVVEMPANALYQNEQISYRATGGPAGAYSRLHEIHDPSTPVHRRYRLAIRAIGLPERLRQKAILATLDEDGDVSSAGGTYEDGFVSTRPRSFDRFFVTVDTTAPTLVSLDLKSGATLGRRRRLRFRARDHLTGISSYKAELDGQWSLLAYDAKKDLLIYDLDPSLEPGTHELTVEVSDGKDNVTRLRLPFER